MQSVRAAAAAWAAGVLAAWLVAGCATRPPCPDPAAHRAKPDATAEIDAEVYRRAETERAARLAREVEQLRDDLRQAEEALVAVESGLRGSYSRADAISNLAEARIRVARAGGAAPWRAAQIAEARGKLDDAERQVEAGRFGAALFFVYRAERIADGLEAEARRVHGTPGTRFIRARRVNLRSGPSLGESVLAVLPAGTPVFPETRESPWVLVRTAAGEVGWVHAGLLGEAP